ncbi:MAG: XRE family transcriptional regulator [Oscillospiraceae bacterium]|nr:XRE family transcriptional regulator [Oscillospiraceae bacterium]
MFSTRLKELRKARGVSQVALAKELEVTQQAVGKWETGRSTPDPQTVTRLAEYFGTTTDYILGHEAIAAPALSNIEPYMPAGETPIPIVGTVKAGFGALAFEEDYGTEYARVKDPDSYFYLIVKGDSMMPRIQDGDLALVHRQPTLENGDLGVIVYGEGEGTLKKYIRRNNAIILQPFNPAYQPQIIMGEDLSNVYIAGKVVETKTKW